MTTACLHTKAKTVISLDISTFFESVAEEEVRKLWQYFFHFPPQVADLLTRLTTYKGRLPRGAPSSSYLANLMFWDVEPSIHDLLEERGIIYSRFVDDVSLSAKRRLNRQEIGEAIGQVYGMFYRKGVMPNREKQSITHNSSLRIHNINVNDVVPTIPKQIRREVRAEIHSFVAEVEQHGLSDELKKRFEQLRGKTAWIRQFHPDQGLKLQEKLLVSVLADRSVPQ